MPGVNCCGCGCSLLVLIVAGVTTFLVVIL
jgi:hypothetical protein